MTRPNCLRRGKVLACLLLLFSVVGCSSGDATPTTYAVNGSVRLPTGLPATGAEIHLVPKNADGTVTDTILGHARLEKDGTFTIQSLGDKPGVPAGDYVVKIDPRPLRLLKGGNAITGMQTIPKKYWSEATSDLTVEISAEKPDWVIQLQ